MLFQIESNALYLIDAVLCISHLKNVAHRFERQNNVCSEKNYPFYS